jgi:hypothetical protein
MSMQRDTQRDGNEVAEDVRVVPMTITDDSARNSPRINVESYRQEVTHLVAEQQSI